MMKRFTLMIGLLFPSIGLAGNQWLMESNAKQMVELNRQLIAEIEPNANGVIHIEALVFSEGAPDGEHTRVYRLSPVTSKVVEPDHPTQTSEIFTSPKPYQSKIRIGRISFDDKEGAHIRSSGALSELDADFIQRHTVLQTILEEHPTAKFYDLQAAPVNIDHSQEMPWGQPKLLIYW